VPTLKAKIRERFTCLYFTLSTCEGKKQGKIYRYILYCVYMGRQKEGDRFTCIYFTVSVLKAKRRERYTGIYFEGYNEGKNKGNIYCFTTTRMDPRN
jgi:hypothetical protein